MEVTQVQNKLQFRLFLLTIIYLQEMKIIMYAAMFGKIILCTLRIHERCCVSFVKIYRIYRRQKKTKLYILLKI